jgi:hypothetical protein
VNRTNLGKAAIGRVFSKGLSVYCMYGWLYCNSYHRVEMASNRTSGALDINKLDRAGVAQVTDSNYIFCLYSFTGSFRCRYLYRTFRK